MHIYGINKTTLLDFPGQVGATFFTGTCNWRCPFCHNKDLVLNSHSIPYIEQEKIDIFLAKRAKIISGICISGGEPTLNSDLPAFIKNIKQYGYLVKLDTNGTNPKMLGDLIADGLIDYVAMDIKSDPSSYGFVTGMNLLGDENADFDLTAVNESIEILKNTDIDYEFRTTVMKEFHTQETFKNIGHWLHGARSFYMQAYCEDENVICPGFHTYTKDELIKFSKILMPHFDHVGIRGV